MTRLAAVKFANLTKCERGVLQYADVKTTTHGDLAICGASSKFEDPSNDPKNADKWDHRRDLRAELIRWLCVDPDAVKLVDPGGIRVLGARVTGGLNLAHVRVPGPLELRSCSIPEEISLDSTEIPNLNLNGSHTGSIYAPGIKISGRLEMGSGFDAAGEVFVWGAKIDGNAVFSAGRFHHIKGASPRGLGPGLRTFEEKLRAALDLSHSQIKGMVLMGDGFESQGAVLIFNSSIGWDFNCAGGRFINPGNFALGAGSVEVAGDVEFSDPFGADPQVLEADGAVDFGGAQIGAGVNAAGARFRGARTDRHGFFAPLLTAKALFWRNVQLENDGVLDLGGANVAFLIDEPASWPKPGKLVIDGFKYQFLIAAPDVTSRLKWIGLNASPADPQPFDQLAKFYTGLGAISAADEVLIARDDAVYGNAGGPRMIWGKFLKITVGYGHQPLRTVIWMLGVVAIGWVMVAIGKRAGVMAPTWPENRPAEARKTYERLSPLLYSLDVFVPFVNLHQEHYWWPDADADGQFAILGRRIHISGGLLRRYLWLQIIAGWLLSAIFIAGITGLLRND